MVLQISLPVTTWAMRPYCTT